MPPADPIRGYVAAIYLTPNAGATPCSVETAAVHEDRGLEGDRYAAGTGSFSRWPGSGRAVTLIEQEALDAIAAELGLDLSAGTHRRNLVTIGVRLTELNGRRFRIGTTLLRGARLCAPCRYLERLTGPGTFNAMKGRGGLRADVLEGGIITVGDPVEPIGHAARLP